jgi:hypothetical protein
VADREKGAIKETETKGEKNTDMNKLMNYGTLNE